MKIAWFTPLPAQSAIGYYSQEAVAELKKKDEVTVFAPATALAMPSRSDDESIETVGKGLYGMLFRRLKAYDLVVYNMGNHPHNHRMIYEVSIRHPGIIILHDLVMRDFFRGYHLLERPDLDGLASHVIYNGGCTDAPESSILRRQRCNEILSAATGPDFPMFKSALRRCLGVVVHSEYSRERVAAAASAPVVRLDFPPLGPCAIHAKEQVNRLPHPSGKVRLLTFGFLNPYKMVHDVIAQIGNSPYLRDHVIYTIVGEAEGHYGQRLQNAISAHNLTHAVSLAGRLSDHDLWQELTQTDVVVNLRNPHMGESSASLLNALFAGTAVMVWNHGSYAEFPDDVVYKVSSQEDLPIALERLCRDRSLREGMGINARRHALAHYDVKIYCGRFHQFADVVRSARPVLALTDLVSDRLLEFGTPAPNGLVERLAREVAHLAGDVPKKNESLAA